MTNATTDTIPALLRLDPSNEGEAVRLRAGIARLAGWTHRYEDTYPGWFSPDGIEFYPTDTLPCFESSLAAAVTLPIDEGAWWDIQIYTNGKATARIPLTVSSHLRLADPPYEEADKDAWAACKAWLAYKLRLQTKAELARRENTEPGRTESEGN